MKCSSSGVDVSSGSSNKPIRADNRGALGNNTLVIQHLKNVLVVNKTEQKYIRVSSGYLSTGTINQEHNIPHMYNAVQQFIASIRFEQEKMKCSAWAFQGNEVVFRSRSNIQR